MHSRHVATTPPGWLAPIGFAWGSGRQPPADRWWPWKEAPGSAARPAGRTGIRHEGRAATAWACPHDAHFASRGLVAVCGIVRGLLPAANCALHRLRGARGSPRIEGGFEVPQIAAIYAGHAVAFLNPRSSSMTCVRWQRLLLVRVAAPIPLVLRAQRYVPASFQSYPSQSCLRCQTFVLRICLAARNAMADHRTVCLPLGLLYPLQSGRHCAR